MMNPSDAPGPSSDTSGAQSGRRDQGSHPDHSTYCQASVHPRTPQLSVSGCTGEGWAAANRL
ncbi:hypothetical protein GN958_ATG00586 [Phytophthora infestans]|uniref:Uncharacterized protein n=1 Tax=Phytophthora infestans TaxID=4787 RepID=A0A8S9VAZ2_PHYIN|nr:hypothetical protein GN958_ATG00586 [Phytophthora infestans]